MQFRNLKRQYEHLKPEIDAAIAEVVNSSAFIMGQPVRDLESALSKYVGVKHCLTCGNGTDALTLALKAIGVTGGDAVFVPDFTFFASAEVISLEGATPIFVDVDESTFNMDASDLENLITKTIKDGVLSPKAVIAVDLFGLPANYREIKKIAAKYNLVLIEDGAQGFGSEMDGSRACSFGDISTTSFFPAKPLGCYGDGGAVFTNNDEWASLIDSLRVHGKGSFKYDNVRIGINSRLDTIQAAILNVKFKTFVGSELERVNAAAARYSASLGDVLTVPEISDGFRSSWAQYTVKVENENIRTKLQEALKSVGIPTMIYYPKPMHEQTAYKSLGYPKKSNSVTAKLCQQVLSLPICPYISNDEIDMVAENVIKFINTNK